jgi:hypothetical protein
VLTHKCCQGFYSASFGDVSSYHAGMPDICRHVCGRQYAVQATINHLRSEKFKFCWAQQDRATGKFKISACAIRYQMQPMCCALHKLLLCNAIFIFLAGKFRFVFIPIWFNLHDHVVCSQVSFSANHIYI